MSEPSARERIAGCFLGGAIGDALGAPIEFDSLAVIHRRHGGSGVTGYVPSYYGFGAITDDTQMTLFTAEGLIRAHARFRDRGIVNVPWIVHRAYCRWLVTQGGTDLPDPDLGSAVSGWLITNDVLHQQRAPGGTCLSALESGSMGSVDHPLNNSKGCGGVMRVAPAGLIGRDAFSLGTDLAALTHGHPSGYLAAGTLAAIIQGVSGGLDLPSATELARSLLVELSHHDETLAAIDAAVALAAAGDPSAERVETLGQGWVAEEALAIALYCALVAPDVRSGLLLAVNHGGDSDSTGAIAGNLLGAMHGVSALPGDLLDDLEARDLISQVATDFADAFVDGVDLPFDRYPTY